MMNTCSTRIGTSIAAAGEPYAPYPTETVPPEVAWGQNLRDRRTKQLPLGLTPKSVRDVLRPKPEKQMVLRPEPMQNMHLKRLYQDKLVGDSKVINRFALSPKQHIKLLAVPKKHPYSTHSHRPVLKYVKGCTPRLRQLSVPNRHNLLSTFVDYKNILPYEKVDKLYETLQHKATMDVPDAETYFEDEDKVKLKKMMKLKRRQRRRELRRQRQMTRWITRTAEGYASGITNYLCGIGLIHQNHTERAFSDQILAILKKNGKIDKIPSRKSHSHFQRGVLQVSDQAAHFAMNIVLFLDAKQIGWGDESTSTVTTPSIMTPTDSSDLISIPEDIHSISTEISIHIEEEPEYQSEILEAEESLDEIIKKPSKTELYNRMAQLVDILNEFFGMQGNDAMMGVFDSARRLPTIKFLELLEATQELHEAGTITGPFEQLVHAFRKKLTEYVEKINPESLDSYMQVAINMVAYKLAKAKYEEYLNMRHKREEEEIKEESEEDVISEILMHSPSMLSEKWSLLEEVKDKSELGSAKLSETGPIKTESSIYDQQDEETDDDFIITTDAISKCPPLTIMPHSPTMVCCASVQAWASWTKDVADNARNWCLWIHQTISELRYMGAVVRGEVINPDGRQVVLRRDEWNAFVTRLDSDVVRWRAYNQHVQSLTEDIIAHFKDKKVQCCAKCLEEGYDLHRLETEHLSEELLDALNTTQYWRKWLNGMVNEATLLTNIIEVPDEVTILDYSTANDVSLIAEAMVMQMATSKDEPDAQSFYSIERVSSQETKNKK